MINFGKKKDDKKASVEKPKAEGRIMHKAVCSNCGNKCEVPFKPTGDKPVFCSDCYKERRNSGSRRPQANKKMYQAICSDCGNRCEVPFNPTGDKPVFCSNCFGKGGNKAGGHGHKQSGGQFDVLNAKLDKILEMLGTGATKPAPKKSVAKKEKATAPKKAPAKKAAKKKATAKKPAAKKKVVKKKK